jgi:fructose-bisphosphate aldolase, class I
MQVLYTDDLTFQTQANDGGRLVAQRSPPTNACRRSSSMNLGKHIRMRRIFSHPSGRILSVAVDHLINYPTGMPEGLRDLGGAIARLMDGMPSAMTMNKGAALRFWEPYAGRVPLIIQSMALRPDEPTFAGAAAVEEVVAMGADAIAVAMFVHCDHELEYVRHLAHVVRAAEPYGLPVIPHIYPLSSGSEQHSVVHDPEAIFYAVRIGLELGADLIKVPYTGDIKSFRDIVSVTPVPVVTAGGPQCATLEDAEQMLAGVVGSGAAGATVGRNVWGFADPAEAVRRLKRVVLGN